jgi:hypothetical protein
MPGRVIKATFNTDPTLSAAVGASCYPDDDTPAGASLPYASYSISSNAPDITLNGTICGYLATVELTIVAESYAGVQAILFALPAAFGVLSGSVGGLNVDSAEVSDLGDEPNGPVDLAGRGVFVGTATVSFYYRS